MNSSFYFIYPFILLWANVVNGNNDSKQILFFLKAKMKGQANIFSSTIYKYPTNGMDQIRPRAGF